MKVQSVISIVYNTISHFYFPKVDTATQLISQT